MKSLFRIILLTWMVTTTGLCKTENLVRTTLLPDSLLTKEHRDPSTLSDAVQARIIDLIRWRQAAIEQAARVKMCYAWLTGGGAAFLLVSGVLARKLFFYRNKLSKTEKELTALKAKAVPPSEPFPSALSLSVRASGAKTASVASDKEAAENSALFRKLDRIVTAERWFIRQDVSRSHLMKCIGVDKNRLARILKQNVSESITATDYISDKRMEYAVGLLKTYPGYNIAAIAHMCGISVSSFNRSFKSKYKMTPNTYRMIL